MRPLDKLPFSEVSPVIKALGNAGFDERVAGEIRRGRGDAAEMMAGYLLHKGWFLTPPEDQTRILYEANKELSLGIPAHCFGIPTRNFFRNDYPNPEHFAGKGVKHSEDGCKGSGWTLKNAPVLMPFWYDPDEAKLAKSISAMFMFLRWRLGNACHCTLGIPNETVHRALKWSGGKAGDDLAWAIMDLISPNHVEEPDGRSFENSSPIEAKHLGLAALAAAAMHPIWVMAMDGERIPHIRIMGSGVTSPKVPWIRMHILGCNGELGKEVVIETMDASVPKPEFTVPKVLRYPNS